MRALAHAQLVMLDRPLKVYIDGDSVSDKRRSEVGDTVRLAMTIWRDSLQGESHFEEVAASSKADLTIRFDPQLSYRDRPVGGLADWRRIVEPSGGGEYGWSLNGTISLRTALPNGTPFRKEALLQSALHEFGHLLGLGDDLRGPGVMSAIKYRRPVGAPSLDEIESLIELRREASQIRSEAAPWSETGTPWYNLMGEAA